MTRYFFSCKNRKNVENEAKFSYINRGKGENSDTNKCIALLMTYISSDHKQLKNIILSLCDNKKASEKLTFFLKSLEFKDDECKEVIENIAKNYPDANISFALFKVLKEAASRSFDLNSNIEAENKSITLAREARRKDYEEKHAMIKKILYKANVNEAIINDEYIIKGLANNPSAVYFLEKYIDTSFFNSCTDEKIKISLKEISKAQNSSFSLAVTLYSGDKDTYIERYIAYNKLQNLTKQEQTWWLDDFAQEAIKANSVDVLAYLIQNKLINLEKDTDLFVFAGKYGQLEMLEFLIDQGANVNGVSLRRKNHEARALHSAAEAGKADAVTFLLKKGADIDATNLSDMTALHLAAQGGHSKVVESLINAKADITKFESEGYLPIHYAAEYGHTHIVELLLKAHNDINVKDKRLHSTPLHLAAQYGRIPLAASLIKNGADISLTDRDKDRKSVV